VALRDARTISNSNSFSTDYLIRQREVTMAECRSWVFTHTREGDAHLGKLKDDRPLDSFRKAFRWSHKQKKHRVVVCSTVVVVVVVVVVVITDCRQKCFTIVHAKIS
jgi:hypothetical protein